MAGNEVTDPERAKRQRGRVWTVFEFPVCIILRFGVLNQEKEGTALRIQNDNKTVSESKQRIISSGVGCWKKSVL